METVKTKVILPMWIWEKAASEAEVMKNVHKYMRRYEYKIIEVKKYYAICTRW